MKWIKYLLDSILQQPPFWKIVRSTPLILEYAILSHFWQMTGKPILKKNSEDIFFTTNQRNKFWKRGFAKGIEDVLVTARVQSQSRCWDLGVPLNLYCWMDFQHFWICMRYLQIKIPASTQFAKSVVECVIITSCGRREADEGGSSSHLVPPISCFQPPPPTTSLLLKS